MGSYIFWAYIVFMLFVICGVLGAEKKTDEEQKTDDEIRDVSPEEKLKIIKLENERKRKAEADRREQARKRHEEWIREMAEGLSNKVVKYFIEEKEDVYSFRMVIGFTKAKTTFLDTRRLSQDFVDVFNRLGCNDNEIFFKELKEILESKHIRFIKKFNYASDFGPGADTYDFSFMLF